MKIGLIGLGAMARAMAMNLVAAGHQVSAWTRSGRGMDGVAALTQPGDAFVGDVVLTMLSDDDAVRAVIVAPDLLSRAAPGVIHVVMSTISVAFARELAALHAARGVAFVSAPVLGRPDVAAEGALNILAGGPETSIAALAPVFDALGKKVWFLGEDQAGASAAKIACNMMIAMAIEAMAEAVSLTEANGVGRDRFFELILNTLFGSRSYQVYSRTILGGTFEPGFRAVLGLKDLRLATEAAVDAGHSLPMLDAVHAQMGRAVSAGLGERDWSIMASLTLGETGAAT